MSRKKCAGYQVLETPRKAAKIDQTNPVFGFVFRFSDVRRRVVIHNYKRSCRKIIDRSAGSQSRPKVVTQYFSFENWKTSRVRSCLSYSLLYSVEVMFKQIFAVSWSLLGQILRAPSPSFAHDAMMYENWNGLVVSCFDSKKIWGIAHIFRCKMPSDTVTRQVALTKFCARAHAHLL